MNILDITESRNRSRLFLVFALLIFCCFANTLRSEFVYDDRYQIVEAAPVLQNWQVDNLVKLFDRDIWAFFSQELSWEEKIRTAYYRPFFAFFVMINYSYSGLNPVGWHLTGILLHIVAVLLAYRLLLISLRMTGAADKSEAHWMAIIGSIFFAIHPAQSESVAWIAAYVDALSTIFIFGALLTYLRARSNPEAIDWKWILPVSIFYALALLTKELAVVVPVIIAAYELMMIGSPGGWREGWRKRLKVVLAAGAPILVLTFGYFALRIAIFGAVRPSATNVDFPEMLNVNRSINLFTFPAIVLKYVEIIVWPFSLSPMYAVRYVITPGLLNFFLPVATLVLLSVAGMLAAYRSVLVRIGLIWLIVPLLPALDTRSFKPEDLVHDRYLYISVLGAGLLFAGLCRWLNSSMEIWAKARNAAGEKMIAGVTLRLSVVLIPAAIILLMSALTIRQNIVWTDEWHLWMAAGETVPDSCIVNLELGRLNEEEGRNLDALSYYEFVRQKCPDSLTVYYKLGLFYGRNGDLARAESAFQHMASLSSLQMIKATAHFNLGVVYEKKGDLGQAIDHYKEGLALNPASKNADQVRQIIDELTAKLTLGTER
jgi:protein O-mannosyl-transferase